MLFSPDSFLDWDSLLAARYRRSQELRQRKAAGIADFRGESCLPPSTGHQPALGRLHTPRRVNGTAVTLLEEPEWAAPPNPSPFSVFGEQLPGPSPVFEEHPHTPCHFPVSQLEPFSLVCTFVEVDKGKGREEGQ